jgi:hypothetical protein
VVLIAGMGNPGSQLAAVRDALGPARVCWYDRPGLGASDPVTHPQNLTSVVNDLAAFLEQAAIEPPYVLVGHSFGASEVIRYAQVHPNEVAGFIAMNPVPPYHEWIRRANEVETPEELKVMEIDFYKGSNEESIDLTDTDLTLDPVPDEMPYVVMQSENCDGDFCERIKPVLRKATEELLAHLGAGGRFVAFADRPHDLSRSSYQKPSRTSADDPVDPGYIGRRVAHRCSLGGYSTSPAHPRPPDGVRRTAPRRSTSGRVQPRRPTRMSPSSVLLA